MINLYRLRSYCIVFKSVYVTESLKKMRLIGSSDWDPKSTDTLLDMYCNPVNQNKPSDDQYNQRRIRMIQASMFNSLEEGESGPAKQTVCSSIRNKDAEEYARKIKFQNALMKMTRFRDKPD